MLRQKNSLSDRELAQLQWNFIQSMPKRYWTDMEVNEFYFQELRSRYQKASVFWPALGNRLLPDQITQLKWELQSGANFVFIPINNGSHWNFIVLEKQANHWTVKKVETPADGLCGKHTVTQSMQVLDQGLEKYTANNPHRVSDLHHNDPIRLQIDQALKTDTAEASAAGEGGATAPTRSSAVSFYQDQYDRTIRESIKINKNMSRFDFKLAKLAEYELLGYSIESLCEELAQMLADMEPDARNAAINRLLESSKLAQKPSIVKVIEGCHQKLAKHSHNPYLLMSRPQPAFRRAKILDEDQNYHPISRAAGG